MSNLARLMIFCVAVAVFGAAVDCYEVYSRCAGIERDNAEMRQRVAILEEKVRVLEVKQYFNNQSINSHARELGELTDAVNAQTDSIKMLADRR